MGVNEMMLKRVERIEESIRRLRKLAERSKEEFLRDWLVHDAALYSNLK